MSALVVVTSFVLVALVEHRVRPVGRRRRAPSPGPAADAAAGGTIGTGRTPARRIVAIDRTAASLGGAALALVVGVLGFGPLVGVLGAIGVGISGPVARQVGARRRREAVAAAVPDLVDLFLVAASAGRPVASSLVVVAPRSPPAVAAAMRQAAARLRRGQPLDECLHDLGRQLGPIGTPLTDALQQAARTGAPLVPLLEGVAGAARDRRRRRSQEVARRLPVTMLLPLVACILPAAILLAVVPVLLVSVASLTP